MAGVKVRKYARRGAECPDIPDPEDSEALHEMVSWDTMHHPPPTPAKETPW